MTETKSTGPMAAAKEICQFASTWSEDSIEAIILKHYPQDKAVEKLLEALEDIIAECPVSKLPLGVAVERIARSALHEYEEVKK